MADLTYRLSVSVVCGEEEEQSIFAKLPDVRARTVPLALAAMAKRVEEFERDRRAGVGPSAEIELAFIFGELEK